MTTSMIVLITATLALVVLSAAFSQQRIRERLIGAGGTRTALIPLVAAMALWAAAFSTDLLKGRIEEGTAPNDVLAAFVESISFGIPTVSMDFFSRFYSVAERRKELSSLMAANEPIRLSDEEIERLNDIAGKSGQLDQVDKHQTLTTKSIAGLLSDPVAYGFNYANWAKVSNSWEVYLRTANTQKSKLDALNGFVSQIQTVMTAAGLFQGIVGMRSRKSVSLSPVPGDCSRTPLGVVNVETMDGKVYLMFSTFRSMIGEAESSAERKKANLELAALFQYGCIDSLANLFRDVGAIFSLEEKLMRQYVAEWNRILASKEAETITIRIAVANVGRFDSFLRREAKVAVGTKGAADKITFQADLRDATTERQNDEQGLPAPQSDYIQVKSRSTATLILQTHLPPEIQRKLHGAFQSEQTLLRLGLLASAGSSEGEVFTQTVQFSAKAQQAAKERVQQIKVNF